MGAVVRAEAVLTRVDGRRLEFRVVVTDQEGPVAEGLVQRAVVDRVRFGAQASARA